jgi:hypothetical protein
VRAGANKRYNRIVILDGHLKFAYPFTGREGGGDKGIGVSEPWLFLAPTVEWLTGEVKPLRRLLNRAMLEGCSTCW